MKDCVCDKLVCDKVVCERLCCDKEEEEEEEEAVDGIQNQKQEPHTMLWGKMDQCIFVYPYGEYRIFNIRGGMHFFR